VFSINGVLTSSDEAQMNSDVLKERYQAANPSAPYPRFKVLYNPSGKKYVRGAGGAIDFIEVIMQQTGLNLSRAIRMIMAQEPIPEPFKTQITNVLSAVAVMSYNPDSATLARMLTGVNAEIDQGSKVLLVAHSQGNLWANSLIALVADGRRRAALGQVGIAVPDAHLEKASMSHITLTEDLVIRAVPLALAPNTTNGYSLSEILARTLGHNFVSAYMDRQRPSERAILSTTRDSFAALTPIPNPSGQGPFTVTLTWGAQPDVDLHVFEPNGNHVYYTARSGVAGYLDVDDTSSFGPEHYYASCASLMTGEYRVGVNYYYGSAPEVASVFIQAGTNSLTRQITLPTQRGPSGNASPVPVARVTLQRNPTTAEIEGAILP
jgi:predicted alpha/beta hydrolase family esterase